jgi:hypothetical protein
MENIRNEFYGGAWKAKESENLNVDLSYSK